MSGAGAREWLLKQAWFQRCSSWHHDNGAFHQNCGKKKGNLTPSFTLYCIMASSNNSPKQNSRDNLDFDIFLLSHDD
jgi:hypothetical protein